MPSSTPVNWIFLKLTHKREVTEWTEKQESVKCVVLKCCSSVKEVQKIVIQINELQKYTEQSPAQSMLMQVNASCAFSKLAEQNMIWWCS